MTPERTTIRRVGVAALAIVGVIHLLLSPEYLQDETYIGVLFIAGGIGSLLVAARLWFAADRAAGTLGAVIAGGMFVGFILSRTTGLPGFKEPEWELSGILSLILEAIYLGTFAAWVRSLTPSAAAPAAPVAVPFVARNSSGRATPRRPSEPVTSR